MQFGIKLKGVRLDRKKGQERWIEDLADEILERINPILNLEVGQGSSKNPCLYVRLHPAAEPLVIEAAEDGTLRLRAKTIDIGPGYHIAVCDFIKSLSRVKRLSWDVPSSELGTADDTGYLFTSDRTALNEYFTTWLKGRCQHFCEHRNYSRAPRYTTYPGCNPAVDLINRFFEVPDSISFFIPGALGYKDKAWIMDFMNDTSKACEFFPWWHEGEAGNIFGMALFELWYNVAWRSPANDDEAHKLLRVLRDLETAYEMNPNLPFPWAAWAELYEHLGDYNQPSGLKDQVLKKAERLTLSTIGYRRGMMRVGWGDWSVRVSGDCKDPVMRNTALEIRFDSKAERVIRMSEPRQFCPGREGAPLSAEELVTNLTLPEPIDGLVLELRDDGMCGKAWWEATYCEGKHYHWLKTIMAIESQSVLTSIFVEDANDKEWALETWKTIAPNFRLNIFDFETFAPDSNQNLIEVEHFIVPEAVVAQINYWL